MKFKLGIIIYLLPVSILFLCGSMNYNSVPYTETESSEIANIKVENHVTNNSRKFGKDGNYYQDLQKELHDYTKGKDARIGIGIIINGEDTVSVNGNREFPMLSVYKFPQAISVADYCVKNGLKLESLIEICADDMKKDTWSPMRDKYGITDIKLTLSELLEYSLQQSDNNACDILFKLIGSPEVTDSLMKSIGYPGITVTATEDEMHKDIYLCYQNRSTPLEMARLFNDFYCNGLNNKSSIHKAIGEMMISCNTGLNRLPFPLKSENITIGHKTGTGDINSQGRIIGINDAGYVFLPNGEGYSISVFLSDSAYDMVATEKMIGDISSIVYTCLTSQTSK